MKSPDLKPFSAGVARIDITTDDPSVVVHDRLFVKALALEAGDTRVLILSLDAVAIGGICDIGDDFLPELRGGIEAQLGVPGANVLVHATHTHPPGKLLCGHDEQVARCLEASRLALANLAPVRVGVGRGRNDRIAINRTLRLRDGRQWSIRHTNPSPPDDLVESLGPLDPEVGVVRFDRLDGTPLAVLYNYACHPLLGVPGGAVTANFPGFASAVIERHLGHDAMAIFLQGAAGDVTEVLWKEANRPRDSRPVGESLGLSVVEVLQSIRTRDESVLRVAGETVLLPRRADIAERIAELREEQRELLASLRYTSMNFRAFLPIYLRYALNPDHPADYRYRYLHEADIGSRDLEKSDVDTRAFLDKYLSNLRAVEALAQIEDQIATHERHRAINDAADNRPAPAEVQAIRIGDTVILAAPIEMLTRVGLNVKQSSPHAHTFIAAFSNGYMHYGPPAEDYGKGGYEVTECFLAPQWQAIFEASAARMCEAVR